MNAELIKTLRADVLERLALRRQDADVVDVSEERLVARQIINDVLDEHAQSAIIGAAAALDVETEDEISQSIYDSIFGLGRLQRLLDDPSIENINVNGCDVVVVRYADGSRARVDPIADSDAELIEMIRNAAARLGPSERRFDLGSPYVDLHLPDGSRLAAIMAVADRPSIAIRRHRYLSVDLDELTNLGMINKPIAHLLRALVLARMNLMVSGGTGAGKTTLLRALIAAIPSWERLITIEDSRELGVKRQNIHDDVVSLEERIANVEGEGRVTVRALVRMGLRMSPDRVLVGEVRGQEVIDMLNAMGQGNNGSLSTIHAKSSLATFGRIATYAIQSEERFPPEATNLLVANALDFVVFISHDPATGRRFVSSIREIVGAEGHMVVTNEIVRADRNGNVLPGARLTEDSEYALAAAGFDATFFYNEGAWQ
jgi:pilus assembly protein CpaF